MGFSGTRRRGDDQAVSERPLLVLTRIWPTPTRPSVGSFIKARVQGMPNVKVVRPRWPQLPRAWIYLLLLVDTLRAPRPRGIEAHMLVPTGFIGLVAARLRAVPLLVYVHGGDVRDWAQRPAPVRWMARLVARGAERLVTNSEDTARHIRQLGVEPVVAPPGVDLRRFVPTPRPNQRRVLYLGGRNPRKGYGIAVGLADTLVGPWLRDVEPDEVPALIAAHDVVLVPSVEEPFGLVAVEAIASGRWVVASAVGGLRDIVVDGVNGTLVSDGDFAGALARVPDYDPYAIASTVERYSLERWQSAMHEIWQSVRPA
jgi:glycosyltransferase involved in cell wall biosynthesis